MALYIIPTFISENLRTLSPETAELASGLDEFIVENEKSARQFLKSIEIKFAQKDLVFHLLNEHTSDEEISGLLPVIKQKKDIGLLSEAGCPGVADPGASVVRLAHENNIRVVPLTGPSSILLALMSSGLNGQSFVFHGYLPREAAQRKSRLKLLESDAIRKKQTQIFIEAPYRNNAVMQDLLETCKDETLLCIAADLTSKGEKIFTRPVSEWKKNKPDLNKVPVIFLLGV